MGGLVDAGAQILCQKLWVVRKDSISLASLCLLSAVG
jgi:hypothetical protein